MTEQKHDEIMTNIMKQLEEEKLNLADGISIWNSLGRFLFSHMDKENKDVSEIYEQMKEYLTEMQNAK